MQRTFNPANYCFAWTDDGWYEWDRKEAHKQALRVRNRGAKRLRAQGMTVSCFTHSGQLISRGGIGSGHPHIELVVNVYGLNAR